MFTISVCTDEMGLDNGAMNDEQVTVSSSMIDNFHGKEASFSSPKGWTPLTNSPNEWIQVQTHTALLCHLQRVSSFWHVRCV